MRVFIALGGRAGLRLGAIAGLRWGDLDTTAASLWRLTSGQTDESRPTKTGKPNRIPVHPVLADMLTSWPHGRGQMFGRPRRRQTPSSRVSRAPGRVTRADRTRSGRAATS
jgi:integrase